MSDLSNKILSVFVDKQVQSLKDSEISRVIHSQGIKCFPNDVSCIAQQLSPSLFQISLNRDNSMTITIDPKIEICNAFLSGQCHSKIKPCNKLHICRNFGQCRKTNCRFPHDLYHGQNHIILQENQCLNLDSQLLIRLLRLNKNLTRQISSISEQIRDLSKQDDMDKQIDVSYPSKQLAKHVDMEIIELMLNTKDIQIEKKLSEGENEVFRRETIQLTRIEDIDKLLQEPIIHCENVNIKFKRTKQLIDQSAFELRVALSNSLDSLTEPRIRLYIALLIGNTNQFNLYDISTTTEQIYLVHCQQDIDFDKVRLQYQSRRTLQNHEITINQIYECDQVTIAFQDQNKSMNFNDIERIIPLAQEKIFTFETLEPHAIDVEFITTQAFRQWMSISDRMKIKYQLIITPLVTIVEETNVSNSTTLKKIKITLRPDWTMVANHTVFGKEYRDYMREQLGGEIEINGSDVIFIGNVPRMPRCPTDVAVIVNKTNNYMQKLHYKLFRDLKPHHIRILRTNSNIIAFSQRNGNDYAIAARPQDLIELKGKLFSKFKPTGSMYSSMEVLPLMSSKSIERRTSAIPELHPMNYAITNIEEINMFTIDSFEERLRKYLEDKFHIKIAIERNILTSDKVKNGKSRIFIKIYGKQTDFDNVTDELMNLFADLKINNYDDAINGNWVKLDEAIDILRHHFTLQKLLCSIQRTSPTSICINYFSKTGTEFDVDSERIDELINKQFSSTTINLPKQTLTNKFQDEWTNLEEKIRTRDDYRKDICLSKETQSIYLFGLTKLIKDYRQLFEEIKNKTLPQLCQINFSEKQKNYLVNVAQTEVNKLAEQYKNDGCDLSIERLIKNGDFLAPSHLHSVIKDSLQTIVDLNEITFEIENNAFALLIKQTPLRLATIVKSKCDFEIKEQTKQIEIIVAKAQAADLTKRTASVPASSPPPSQVCTRVKVNNSTIKIILEDLTTQKVDVIVVCFTSEILRNAIIKAAGTQVRTEFEAYIAANRQTFGTSSGSLPCKKILFLPWKVDQSNPLLLQPSLEKFVSQAINYTAENGYQTLAFPSVGCGKLGFDPALIAQHMISAAVKHLQAQTVKLEISFVLISSQQNVYDEFVKYLNTLTKQPVTSPKPTTNQNLTMPYTETIVQITLTSTNKNHLNRCKTAIVDLAKSLVSTAHLKRTDMIDWPQKTINEYYQFCLKQYIKPTLNLDESTLDLFGPKDAVQEAERHFYELTAKILKEACRYAVARNVIWSVETTPNSNTWEQYSYELNGIIEDAKFKNLPHIDFIDDKRERCRIIFDSMQEFHGTDTRRVRRMPLDSLLPEKWNTSDQNCTQIILESSSQEYQDVLQQFNTTMIGQYNQIIKIERIQNIRWYKQYVAHRDDHQRKYGKIDERSLFHGCQSDSANKIIQQCFNRSFAGVNGVAYGCGVYFHTHASYSHAYARANPPTNERTMFLAKVLVGQSCLGNQSMKTPPHGCDTTNDGKHIFVVYHDAGAYAEYLITYK